jgi:hypothetical protein
MLVAREDLGKRVSHLQFPIEPYLCDLETLVKISGVVLVDWGVLVERHPHSLALAAVFFIIEGSHIIRPTSSMLALKFSIDIWSFFYGLSASPLLESSEIAPVAISICSLWAYLIGKEPLSSASLDLRVILLVKSI